MTQYPLGIFALKPRQEKKIYLLGQWSDLARQPHAWCLQLETNSTRLWVLPIEVTSTTANSVDTTRGATPVPESASVAHCTVVVVGTVGPRVVVTVIGGKHHSIVPTECVNADVTREPRYPQRIVGRLAEHNERTVLGPVPGVIGKLQIKSQLVEVVCSQLMQYFVAEPVVASRVVEPDFKLRPRAIEGARAINVLLDQQWDTISYKQHHYR